MAIKTPKETILNEDQIKYTVTKKPDTEDLILNDNSKVKSASLIKVEIIKLLQQIILESTSTNVKSNANKCIKLLENI